MKNGYMGKVLGVDAPAQAALAPTLLARNGYDVLKSSSESRARAIRLEMFEFAVVLINVACHGCEFEAEFLEGCVPLQCPGAVGGTFKQRRSRTHARCYCAYDDCSCSALWLPARRTSRCADLTTCRCALIPDSYHRGNIRVPIVDESVIWRHYTSISGRFMVRRSVRCALQSASQSLACGAHERGAHELGLVCVQVLDCRTSWDESSGAANHYLFKSPTRSVRKTSIS